MNIANLLDSFTDLNILNFFFKAFAVVFSLMYVIYSVVILKQTQIMIKTIESDSSSFILLISIIQLFVAILLLLFSFTLI
ncbi:hypothetical protein A3C28_05935 [Candidatus Roizmanbacteria bacterium RIFCSPHIGHO2_02_FULL_39_9]|uniref:Uncharacterized protein n=1 Tax=Candidatus Roizmanbacteria bacterium RIFCSPHIGHO2_02_FULL_39_9 TaxID=1802040 RepID=A0A1F7H8Y4_9BACT|nr:MAG: hypothetical protein A3C28_05935 [Candidatus Roizmanbacteria bacterium RIFCSPHIGHO2_02_FULL_39_9]